MARTSAQNMEEFAHGTPDGICGSFYGYALRSPETGYAAEFTAQRRQDFINYPEKFIRRCNVALLGYFLADIPSINAVYQLESAEWT
jgi:hypothetical protein